MTGLLGGGHAIYFDAANGTARNLDCFVSVPSGDGAPMESLEVPFGEELVRYAIGAASCAVPGIPAGLDHSGARTAACRGRGLSSLRSASRATACRCRPRTSRAS